MITDGDVEELRRRQDSLIENIGALQMSMARIEWFAGYHKPFPELVIECREPLLAHGQMALAKRIDRLLRETAGETR